MVKLSLTQLKFALSREMHITSLKIAQNDRNEPLHKIRGGIFNSFPRKFQKKVYPSPLSTFYLRYEKIGECVRSK